MKIPFAKGGWFAGRVWQILVALCLLYVPLVRAATKQTLYGHVPSAVLRLTPEQRLPKAQRLRLAISLPLRNQDALKALLQQLADPTSPNYRQYLTPAQFTERFGPTLQDYETVVQFANANGLRVTGRHPNRVIVDVEADVSTIEKALHVKMHSYQHPKEARKFYAPDVEPSVDLAVPILQISGLDDYSIPHPNLHLKPAGLSGNATPNAGSGPSGAYAGGDFRAAYVPGTTLTGSGQSVGLVQFDGYYAGDIAAYKAQFGLPDVPLINVPIDGGVSTPGNGNSEVCLDIEMVISMAPGVSAIYVYEAPNPSPWVDILNRMANDNLCKQLSCSWGGGASNATAEGIFQQMAAQGQSFFNATGDSDAFTGSISFPSDSPNITEVGATTLTTTGAGGAYVGETVWNWNNGTGSSGGSSTYYSMPTWQQGISMTANQGSATMRNVPDVAMAGDGIFVCYNNGGSGAFGGTSCAAPLWAAFTALVNEQGAWNGQPPVGFINPAIYTIGSGSNYNLSFHDTTSGNNFSSASPTKYQAATGYDLCTGLGAPAGIALINALVGAPIPIITTGSALPYGVVGLPYNQSLTASGGQPPYSWTILSGSLPSGLDLSSSGLISGTPSNSAAANFTVRITDSNATSSTRAFALAIYEPGVPIITSSNSLPSGYATIAYRQTLTATGGATPYTWAISSGNLPSGLSLSSDGVLSGTPATAGTSNFSLQVTGSDALSSTSTFSLVIKPGPPVISSSLSATGTNGTAFSYQITATNNPVSFSATGLPAGLSLAGSTGVISGTPSVTGTFNATISATNSAGAGSATLVLQLAPIPAPVIQNFVTLCSFSGVSGDCLGSHPCGPIIRASDGNLYGTTRNGGTSDNGTVFKIDASGRMSSLVSFNGTNGSSLIASLTEGNNGSLYGVTTAGATYGKGNVFKVTPTGELTTLYAFGSGGNQSSAYAGLVQATDGLLYGVTSDFATGGSGSSFKMTPEGNLTWIYSFSPKNPSPPYYNSDGVYPYYTLIQANDGNFYGAAAAGGTNSRGTIYRLTSSGSFSVVYAFDFTHGDGPYCKLTQGSDANIYGTTNYGGAYYHGTIFKMTPTGSISTLYSFDSSYGNAAAANGLVQGNDGYFYGTTAYGGTAGYGTIFKITSSGSFSTVCSFTGANAPCIGANPYSEMTLGSDGIFYGVTFGGGANNLGTAYKYIPQYFRASLGVPFSYQITASNSPSSYQATGLPQGLSVNTATGLISGTASTTGTASVIISAINSSGTSSATLTIGVSAPPSRPVISSTLSATGTSGAAFSYQIAATNNPTYFDAYGLPTGLNVDTTTGIIAGTPMVTGTFVASISATNLDGTGSAFLTLTVLDPAVPPVITSQTATSGTLGVAFSYQITASNSPTSFGATNLPSGLSVNAQTGLLSGTPAQSGTFNASISATNLRGTGSANLLVSIQALPVHHFAFNSIASPQYQSTPFTTTLVAQDVLNHTVPSFTGSVSLSAAITRTLGNVESGGGFLLGTQFPICRNQYIYLASELGAAAQFNSLAIYVYAGPAQPLNNWTIRIKQTTLSSYASASWESTGWTTVYQSNQTINTTGWVTFPFSQNFSYDGINNLMIDFSFQNSGTGASGSSGVTTTSVPRVLNRSTSVSGGDPLLWSGTTPQGYTYSQISYLKLTTVTNLTVTPSTSGPFTGGTWLGSVSIPSTATGVQLTALDSDGHTGTSNSFNVNQGAVMTVSPTGGLYSRGVFGGPFSPAIKTFTIKNTGGASMGWSVSKPARWMTVSSSGGTLAPGFSQNITFTINSNAASLATGTYADTATFTNWTNGIGNTTRAHSLTVLPPPPAITGPLAVSCSKGAAFSYQIAATNNPTSYATNGLPTGLGVETTTGLISGTPTIAGTFNATISASNAGGTGSATLTITVLTPYSAWQARMFTPAQLADPTISSDMAAPAGDGIPNLIKYALNLSPMSRAVSGLPVAGTTSDGSDHIYLTLSYTQVISATDVTYIPEVSDDLQTWNSGADFTTLVSRTDDLNGATQMVIIQDLTPLNSSAKRFMRLKITRP